MYITLPESLNKFVVSNDTHSTRMGGVHTIIKFPNDYGASVVRVYGSYGFDQGLWEMAVIRFEGKGWSITYDTPITNDVLGYLSENDVVTHLQDIQKLN